MLSLALLLLQQPVVSGDRSLVSTCGVSDDAKYGYTRDNPIKVGGTPMYGPARQRRFLQALVGPAGQPIAFRRRGSLEPNAEGIILDVYEVTYPGVEKPIELYLDLYRWDPPKAPQGFLCGTAIGLEAPADPAADRRKYLEFAIRTAGREELPPVPLGADGSTRHGVAIDSFRFIVGAARMLATAGATVTPDQLLKIRGGQFMVIAHELACDGKARQPKTIEVRTRNRQPVPRNGGVIGTRDLRRMLPWATVPDGAVAGMFPGPHLPIGGEVVITYDGVACPAETETVSLPVKGGPPTKITDVQPVPPPDVPLPSESVVKVQVRATIDAEGVPTNLEVVSGPSPFNASATDAIRQWRYSPMTINSAPTYAPSVMVFTVTFSGKK